VKFISEVVSFFSEVEKTTSEEVRTMSDSPSRVRYTLIDVFCLHCLHPHGQMVQHEALRGRAIQAGTQRGGGFRHGRESFPSENIHPQTTASQSLIGIGEGVKAKNTTYIVGYTRARPLSSQLPFWGLTPNASLRAGERDESGREQMCREKCTFYRQKEEKNMDFSTSQARKQVFISEISTEIVNLHY